MSEYTRQSGTEVWAYCLMPNHVHLVMVPSCEGSLRSVLGDVHRRYTRYVNFKKAWRGHFWQERFHSFPMDEKYLLETVRYVELNPVKAKLSTCPQDWRWSSASAYLAGSDDVFVTVKPMLDRIGDWQQYLMNDDSNYNDLVAQHTRTGRPLGSDKFVKKLENICGKPIAPMKPGCPPFYFLF